MFEKLIEYSVKNRMMVLILTALIFVFGINAMRTIPLDAIPDLSDVQVIVFTKYPGQAPQVVEDQVTYPLTTTMLSVPNASIDSAATMTVINSTVFFFFKRRFMTGL